MKGNSKRTYDNSFSPLGAQNKNLVTALKVLQTVLTKVKLRLQRRLARPLVPVKIGINAARPSFSLPGSTPFNREGGRLDTKLGIGASFYVFVLLLPALNDNCSSL